jgi:molybdopterin converting factor small subunit
VRVEVQLFATLAAYLPAATTGDSIALEVPEGTVVAEVLRQLQLPSDLDFLRVVNGHDATPGQVLNEGDVLSLFPPLAGGS